MKKKKSISVLTETKTNKPPTDQRCYMRRLPGFYAGKKLYTAFTPDRVVNTTVEASDRLAAKSRIWQLYRFDVNFYR
jgi:hypothetical protein